MVRQRFYTVLAMQQRVRILDSMVEIARTSHEVSQKLFQAGIGARGDVLLLQIELSRAEAELRNAHILTETSKRELAAATGLYDLQFERVAADLTQALPDYEILAVQQGVISAMRWCATCRRSRSPRTSWCCGGRWSSRFPTST